MYVILNGDVVVATGSNVYPVENGIFCDNIIYGEPGLTIAETDAPYVVPQKHLLIDGVVSDNPNYVEYVSPEQQIAQMQEETDLLTMEIAALKGASV
ncbi:hypothetical protein LPY66_16030 [Dehalobacter sp. DCM]|uniref:hypothetical protein n=1 Tax=Dehalobacter sp. DCM TaxID=2907827 RepID=UPI003081CB8B|nr:hypothetical protein LPY66_16030 [Dehalobacter sp. DCM]